MSPTLAQHHDDDDHHNDGDCEEDIKYHDVGDVGDEDVKNNDGQDTELLKKGKHIFYNPA